MRCPIGTREAIVGLRICRCCLMLFGRTFDLSRFLLHYVDDCYSATVLANDLQIRCFSGRGRVQLSETDTAYLPTACNPEFACNL